MPMMKVGIRKLELVVVQMVKDLQMDVVKQ